MQQAFEAKKKEIVDQLSETLDSDIILFAGPLEKPYDDRLLDCCQMIRHKNVLLLLATFGGQAHVAYRIARHLQRCYDNFTVHIHTFCKSAGTLLALGANEIIMSDYAEMGPLDVQMQKEDELGVSTSGLTITQALAKLKTYGLDMFEDYFLQLRFGSGGQIMTRSAAEIAANLTIGLLNPVYAQIDPMRLGEIDRAIRIALEYGERIGKHNLKERTLEKLVASYPDHGFVIDRLEAEELFKKVRTPTDLESRLVDLVQPIVDRALSENTTILINFTEDTGESDDQARQGGGADPERKGSSSCPSQQGDDQVTSQGNIQGDGQSIAQSDHEDDGETVPAN